MPPTSLACRDPILMNSSDITRERNARALLSASSDSFPAWGASLSLRRHVSPVTRAASRPVTPPPFTARREVYIHVFVSKGRSFSIYLLSRRGSVCVNSIDIGDTSRDTLPGLITKDRQFFPFSVTYLPGVVPLVCRSVIRASFDWLSPKWAGRYQDCARNPPVTA